jgi:hypothetical protein
MDGGLRRFWYCRNLYWCSGLILQIVLVAAFCTTPNKGLVQTAGIKCRANDPFSCAAAGGLGGLTPSQADALIQKMPQVPKLDFSHGAADKRAPAVAYHNSLTDELFVGDRTFKINNHVAALESLGQKNTVAPEGVGWTILTNEEYVRYMRRVKGMDTPSDPIIYNNCVVSKSSNVSDRVLREVRNSCRAVARNPSLIDRLRWGN